MTIKTLYGDNDFPGPYLWAKFYDPIMGDVECHLPFNVCLDCLHLLNVTTAEVTETVKGKRFLIIEVERTKWDGQLEVVTWTPTVQDFAADNLPRYAEDIVRTAWELAQEDNEIFNLFKTK